MYDPNAPSSQEVVALLKTQRVQRVLHKIAKWCTKSEADAEDLTADALACVIDSDDSPWIPSRGTFLTHMTFVMRHIWDQQMRSGRAKHEIAVEDVTRDKMTLSREPRADDELHRRRMLDVERKLAAQLLAEIGGEYPIAKRCYELAREGIDDANLQAGSIGCSVETIYEAHRTLKYHARRILREWEVAEERRMRELREKSKKRGPEDLP